MAALAAAGVEGRAFDLRAPVRLLDGVDFTQGDLLDRAALRCGWADEPRLLVLDEVRVARLPVRFDDSRARRELGQEPAAGALARAARPALG